MTPTSRTVAIVGVLPDIYAAGDVADWLNPHGPRMRIEYRRSATEQSGAVACNPLDAGEPFAPIPFFWTNEYESKIQVHGRIGADHDMIPLCGDPESEAFMMGYRHHGVIGGVLGWNRPGEMRNAQAFRAPAGTTASDLVALDEAMAEEAWDQGGGALGEANTRIKSGQGTPRPKGEGERSEPRAPSSEVAWGGWRRVRRGRRPAKQPTSADSAPLWMKMGARASCPHASRRPALRPFSWQVREASAGLRSRLAAQAAGKPPQVKRSEAVIPGGTLIGLSPAEATV